ncbi:WD40-repeat-containing domain protein, partial [Mycena rosella]
GVTSVAISPDGAVDAGCIDAVVRIWSVATGALGELLHGHPDSVYSVVLMRDGYGIVSRSFDNTLKHWDLRGVTARKEGGKPSVGTTNLLGYKDYVLSVAVLHDAQWVLSGSKDRGVQFWDADGIMQCMLKGHKHFGLRSFICARPPPRETDTRQLCPAPSRTWTTLSVCTVITLSPAKCMDGTASIITLELRRSRRLDPTLGLLPNTNPSVWGLYFECDNLNTY